MKKLLSILVCVLFGVIRATFAQGTASIVAYAVYDQGDGKYVQGGGTVQAQAIYYNSVGSEKSRTGAIGTESTTEGSGFKGGLTGRTKNYWVKAIRKTTDDGYVFLGWYSGTATGVEETVANKLTENDTYQKNYNYNVSGADFFYAVFKKIILPQKYDYQWTLLSDPKLTIQVELTKADGLQVSVENTSNTPGRIRVTPSMTSGTGSMLLTLEAIENVADGDTYQIKLTETSNGGSAVINVTIKNSITVTLVRPTVGVGCIRSELYLGGEEEYVCYNSAENNAFDITDSKKFDQLLTAEPGDGYEFLRWKKNGEYLASHANPYRILYSDGDQITAEFVPEGTAILVVVKYDSNGNPITDGKEYFSLKDAIAATNTTFKTIVVKTSGSLYNLDFETASDGKKEITIPSNVTLLVPGDDSYTVATALGANDCSSSIPSNIVKPYMELMLPTNTRIISAEKGGICVYAKISNHHAWNGTPINPGVIHMGDGAEIVLNSGSTLVAYGYITGNPNKSKVIAKNGAKVYESFQFRDWRGGTVTLFNMVDKDERVFPFSQYYIQNVETKLVLQKGATAYASSAVEVSIVGLVRLTIEIISKDTDSDDDKGIFCIGDNTQVVRWYNSEEDRQMYRVESINSQSKGSAKIGVIYAEISGKAIDSKNYVLPITNNMDITFDNVDVTSKYEFALLPGSQLAVNSNASLTSESCIFIYDKEYLGDPQHNNQGFCFYNATGTGDALFKGIHYTATKSTSEIENIRTAANIEDAKVLLNGVWYVNDGNVTANKKKLNAGVYTTGTSSDNDNYGANVFSTGVGRIVFNVVSETTKTYQYHQAGEVTEEYVEIPVTNVRLRNGGDNSWSAGDGAQAGEEYIYSQSKQKWVLPQEVSFGDWDGYEFLIRLPEPSTVTQNLVVNMITDDELSMDNFEITLPTNSYFAKGTATYDATNKELIIPIIYSLTRKHNLGTPITQDITIVCRDANLGGELDSETITLSAVENYTPEFTVAINNPNAISEGKYVFPMTTAQLTSTAKLIITPNSETTAKLLTDKQWSVTATPNKPFDAKLGTDVNFLSDAQVSFNPQIGGKYTGGKLIISATYFDGTNSIPSTPVEIILEGESNLQTNTLEFANLATIYQGQTINNVFTNLGAITDLSDISYTYQDGTDASGLVELSGSVVNNYALTAKEPTPAITEAKTVTITVKQVASTIMEGTGDKGKSITITVLPPVIWNWSDLYFGETYTEPLVVSDNTTPWTLTLKQEGDYNLVTFAGESPNYQVVVGNGNTGQIYQVVFTFTQGEYTKDLVSDIYLDPRMLGFCVEGAHQFRGVSSKNSTVTYDATSKTASFRPGTFWELNMTGIPNQLTFTASGDKVWYISERDGESDIYTSIISGVALAGNQSIQLKPTTSQVKIEYGAGSGSNGTISELCISKLELSSSHDVVYFPINKDNTSSTKTIVLTHTGSEVPDLVYDEKVFDILVETSKKGTEQEPYYETTVQISGSRATVNVGTYSFIAQQGGTKVNVTIYAAESPQGLPIRLSEDNVKRYYFLTSDSRFTRWDEENRQIVFQDPLSSNVTRYVTMTFEGAPSRLSFRSKEASGWTVEESATGAADSYNPCLFAVENGLYTYQLHYTTRYVRINYISSGRNEVFLSELEIEGDPMLLVNPDELEFSDSEKTQSLTLTAINLSKIKVVLENTIDFKMSHGTASASSEYVLTSTDYPNALGVNKVGDIVINTNWVSDNIVNDGVITIYNEDDDNAILAKVKLVGAGKYLRKEDANKTGIYTGIPDGTRDIDGDGEPNTDYKYTFHGSDYEEYQYHEVDLSKVFAEDGTALFDYLFVYGETTTTDVTNDITAPSGDNGSNARTPYYVYIRDVDAYGKFDRYRFVKMVDNANIGDKNLLHVPEVTSNVSSGTTEDNGNTLYIDVPKENGSVRVYISGFCPYASTGTSKYDEGVFFFRGKAGSKLDVYLEDAHIVARNKMEDGQPFYARGDKRNPTFTEGYARGSGGVLVFENVEMTENLVEMVPFEVTIHTSGNNLLKSNYGCFNYFFGMDPFQISAPIHVRLHSTGHVNASKTTLNFTDEWPVALDADRIVSASTRTNGFLSLQKLNNNAPSIDLGNPLTEVNFRGGQVELQNAQIVSTNYKTTLAISYRAGEYGGANVGLKFAYGIGTDDVGGSVNFYDGTVTIQPMWVAAEYKDYYLIDKDANGEEIKREVGENTYGKIYEYQTTCLRTPKNTKVYGGSICWLRACQHVTSKGGAPSDGAGSLLGQYIYTFGDGDTKNETTGLVESIKFPGNVDKLAGYYTTYHPNGTYGIESVTPDADNKLYFWIPEGYGDVTAERDNILTTWKACMTRIEAGLAGQTGAIGGDMSVERNEEIKYLLYCKIDENIHEVISAGEGTGDNKTYTYKAPVEVPDVAKKYFDNADYTTIAPTLVGSANEHEVLSDVPYIVTDKIYYVTTATADVWQTFTAPFDVKSIWILETYKESALEATELKLDGQNNQLTKRKSVLLEQAKHNADFAAFFGVAMAIGTTDSFDEIYNSYIEWAKIKDRESGLYTSGDYSLRGRYPLTPYINLTTGGTNWNSANFYLNHNRGNWTIKDADKGEFVTHWSMLSDVDLEDGILLHQGETYSMLFPYCVGCDEDEDEREEWDYWSGKFIIFESTDGQQIEGHTIKGRNFLDETIDDNVFAVNPEENQVVVTGNSTFAFLEPTRDIYPYYPTWGSEGFYPFVSEEEVITPTTAFLYGYVPTPENASVVSISRMGKIKYRSGDDDNGGTTTGDSHVPTINGGSDLFVTSIAEGINIAVSEPQAVGVFSATGALLYSGWVETSVDVNLVVNGVYVVVGENESVKIIY